MKIVKIVLNSLIKSIFFYFDLALKLLFWSSISPWAVFGSKWWSRRRERSHAFSLLKGQTALHSLIANVWNDGCSDQIPQRNGLPHSPLFCSRVAWWTKTFPEIASWMGIFSKALLSGSEWYCPVPSSNLKDSTWKANEPLRVHQISFIRISLYVQI